MLSGTILKQFHTNLKSLVGHVWVMKEVKAKDEFLTKVSFGIYLSKEVQFFGFCFWCKKELTTSDYCFLNDF